MGDSLRHRTEWTPSQRKRHQPVEERFFWLDWTYPTPQLNTSCRLIYKCSITSSREQIERIVMWNLGLIWVCILKHWDIQPASCQEFIPGQSFVNMLWMLQPPLLEFHCQTYPIPESSPLCGQSCLYHLVGGWVSTPFEKYAQVKMGKIFPNFRGENNKYLSCQHLATFA